MQRDKITYPIVKKYNPLIFFSECRFCHKEFRRENGFKIIDLKKCRKSSESPIYETYCCSKCGKSIEDVKTKVKKESELLEEVLKEKDLRKRIC